MFTTYKDNFQIQGRSSFDHYNRKGKPKESRLIKNLTIKGDVFSLTFVFLDLNVPIIVQMHLVEVCDYIRILFLLKIP